MSGKLFNCDTWMNLNLEDVICTSKDGTKFWKMSKCYIRGNMIKYLRVKEEIEEKTNEIQNSSKRGGKRGGRGGDRGRGRGMKKHKDDEKNE
jgi:U6 snRNA-associated Sm-like protein LSm4